MSDSNKITVAWICWLVMTILYGVSEYQLYNLHKEYQLEIKDHTSDIRESLEIIHFYEDVLDSCMNNKKP